ncbi:MAG TPA: DUF6176 family protein [Gammaproteobacteria bacterium]|nr:DUF6176 family protein [Gammaproteobacteria bacterium]
MEINCVVIELKKGSLSRVKEWAEFINHRREEALNTLKNEGVTVESFFLAKIEDKDYLVSFMRAKSMKHAHEAVKHSISEIDAYHQQFKKDTWLKGILGETLVDLSRISDEESYA